MVEPLHIRRELQPEMEAIYYLEPTEASLDFLIRDFEENPQQYAAVHLLFTKRLSDALLQRLKKSKVKTKLRGLRELHLDFLVTEERVFHFDLENAMWNLWSPHAGDIKDVTLRLMVDKLATAVVTLGQVPVIRYASGSAICSSMATLLDAAIKRLQEQLPGWGQGEGERPVVLLVDRSYDMVTPFLHELTYQAMCNDLLPINDEKYTFQSEAGTREVLLNENDILWPSLRHKHIADTSSHLISSFRKFIASNAAVKFKSSDVNTLADMSKALRAMPEFQELREK